MLDISGRRILRHELQPSRRQAVNRGRKGKADQCDSGEGPFPFWPQLHRIWAIYGLPVPLSWVPIHRAGLAHIIPLEAMPPPHFPTLIFPGLEIRLHQRRVLKGGADINLTRLEYGALCCLATSPGRVFTKAQIFETVWSMESESCQSTNY